MTFISDALDLPQYSRLYVFSDGVYEISRPDETMMTYAEFTDILKESKHSSRSAIEHTIDAVRKVRSSDQFEDDVSIVEIAF